MVRYKEGSKKGLGFTSNLQAANAARLLAMKATRRRKRRDDDRGVKQPVVAKQRCKRGGEEWNMSDSRGVSDYWIPEPVGLCSNSKFWNSPQPINGESESTVSENEVERSSENESDHCSESTNENESQRGYSNSASVCLDLVVPALAPATLSLLSDIWCIIGNHAISPL